MRKLTSLLLIIIFIVSLIVGIVIGVSVKHLDETPTPVGGTSASDVSSILVLGVNNFEDEQIFLESIWLVNVTETKQQGNKHIDVLMVSFYPLTLGLDPNTIQAQYLGPHDPVRFPKAYLNNLNDYSPLSRIPFLNQSNIYFQEVVVLDEYAMNYLIQLANDKPQLPPPALTDSTFLKPWDDPNSAQTMQHNILEILCSPPQNILQYDHFAHVFDLLPNHLKTTLTPEELASYWQNHINLAIPPDISCAIYP